MSDDFCLIHGYEFMACEKVWGAVPHCTECDAEPVVGSLEAADAITQSHIERFGTVKFRPRAACERCGGMGWLDAIGPKSDGSYITSRPCPRCDGIALSSTDGATP